MGAAVTALLAPTEWTYRAVMAARNAAHDRALAPLHAAPVPVVSIGNISVGGSGKTPFAAWVAGRLVEAGLRPAIALRGYGRDEVLVHRELNPGVPVFADPRRIAAVAAAARAGCDVAILDDGFQHRRLERDLDILLVDAAAWRGNRRLLPRGPWREGPSAARRADLVVAVRKSDGPEEGREVERDFHGLAREPAVVSCRIRPSHLTPLHGADRVPLEGLRGREVLAVAALASPGSFVANLRDAGARVELAAFPDHHEFTVREAAGLARRAAGRPAVTTLKDAVKLRELPGDGGEVWVLHQRVEIARGTELLDRELRRIASMADG
jgi:tetraacyldisaccharide 4'-kinase